jgi:hypothetical protein
LPCHGALMPLLLPLAMVLSLRLSRSTVLHSLSRPFQTCPASIQNHRNGIVPRSGVPGQVNQLCSLQCGDIKHA